MVEQRDELGRLLRDQRYYKASLLTYLYTLIQSCLIDIYLSYGVLFLDALMVAADLANIYGTNENTGYDEYAREDTNSTTFNIRSPGLNVDYMTYAMLSMVENDHNALLDSDTLSRLANKTFSTFFQHYAVATSHARLEAGLGRGSTRHCQRAWESRVITGNETRATTLQLVQAPAMSPT